MIKEETFEDELNHKCNYDAEPVYLHSKHQERYLEDIIEDCIGIPEFNKPIKVIITIKDGEITIKRR